MAPTGLMAAIWWNCTLEDRRESGVARMCTTLPASEEAESTMPCDDHHPAWVRWMDVMDF